MQVNLHNSIIVEKLLTVVPKYKIAKLEAWHVHKKLLHQIRRGLLQVQDANQDYDSYINHATKEKALSKIYHSEDYYNYERDFNLMLDLSEALSQQSPKNRNKDVKAQQLMKQKKTQEELRRQFLRKLKNWQEQKKRLAKRREKIQRKKQIIENNSEQKKRREEEEINAFLRLQKKKVIEGRMRDIEERRAKREEMLQQSSVKRYESLPKFIQYQNKFKRQELRKSLQEKILLKNRKMSLEMNLEQIKEHERAYINRIKERLNIKSQNDNHSGDKISKSVEESFNLHKRNPSEMKKLEEKIKRVKKFEQKLRLIPLKIDEEKKLESQIANDKLKNRQKYNFLSQKALSDQQIYREFKDFDINIDKKEVGNKYFDEFKQKNRLLGRKVESEKVLPTKSDHKDYLKQFRQKRKDVLNPDQFDSYVKKSESQSKKEQNKQFLMQKSELLQKKAIEKIIELKKIEKYQDSIRKEEQIDDNFAKAIKAKIALAKLT